MFTACFAKHKIANLFAKFFLSRFSSAELAFSETRPQCGRKFEDLRVQSSAKRRTWGSLSQAGIVIENHGKTWVRHHEVELKEGIWCRAYERSGKGKAQAHLEVEA